MSSLKEECGVVGVIGDSQSANLVYLGLYALQHRGQEACGIVSAQMIREKDQQPAFQGHHAFGLVADAFDQGKIDSLEGDAAIGHVRYSTQGGRLAQNIQPFSFRTSKLGPVAIAHNGNLTNADLLRRQLESEGSVFTSTSDTEIFVHLLARSQGASLLDKLVDAIKVVRGAYSLVLLSKDRLYALRDPMGFRPLVLGQKSGCYIAASETCALDLIDAQFVREVEPGEVVELSKSSMRSHYLKDRPAKEAFCSFEAIYFGRPDSKMDGTEIYHLRKEMGAQLAKEAPQPEADVVIAIPDSGVPMAIGFAEQANLPFEVGLVRNHYVGRTFIQPSQTIRDFGVKLKLNPIARVLAGKKLLVIDDSIVRGTTCVKIIRMLRQAGAKEVHFRVGSPPITHSCFYGVDTPDRSRLLAAQKDVDRIREFIGADSLAFLSQAGLKEALVDAGKDRYCFACFDGRYPENIFREIYSQPTDGDGAGLQSRI